jgi:hypothetical protein
LGIVGDVEGHAGHVPEAAVEGLRRVSRLSVLTVSERYLRQFERLKRVAEQRRQDRAKERRLLDMELERLA